MKRPTTAISRIENGVEHNRHVFGRDGMFVRSYVFPPTSYTDYTIVPGRANRRGWQGKPIMIRVRELHRFGEPKTMEDIARELICKSYLSAFELRDRVEKLLNKNASMYLGSSSLRIPLTLEGSK